MPFVGEVRIFAGNFPPSNWAFCNGQLLPIAQFTALFSLLGTRFGGNGTSTFALPDLRGRTPLGPGFGPGLTGRDLGESAGAETHTLLATEMPAHAHTLRAASANGTSNKPAGNVLSRTPAAIPNYAETPDANAGAAAVGTSGSSFPHNNMQPYLTVSYIISLAGEYPARP